MRGGERRGEESLPGALVCDSPQTFVVGQAGQAGQEALRGNLAPAQTAASLTVRPGGSYPEAGCNANRTARVPRH